LMEDPALSARLKPGYRALFYGPPGTGKTLAATLLGKRLDLDVYRIDLSQVVSKYIGETEKNLQTLFEIAENKRWILFFDEADALFGKRTSVSSSHDRYANQEVSYLLQRIEDYNGLVILASNFRNNMDAAFTRRFQAMVNFAMPTMHERMLLWRQTLPSTIDISPDLSIEELATHFELTGASILNVIQLATIQALSAGQPLSKNLLVQEIRKEYAKEGRTM
jgi:SpoVK/Ycf46/Vps4 family AAA+-type ATPase